MDDSAQSLVVVWREQSPLGPRRWSLRGISPDGTFYGTVEDYGIKGTTIRGVLSREDNAKLRDLVDAIISRSLQLNAADANVPEWQGLLAIGPYANSKIFYRYRRDDKCEERAAGFTRVIELLRPYVEEQLKP